MSKQQQISKLAGALKNRASGSTAPQKTPKKQKLLKRDGFMSPVTLAERHDPDAWYQTRKGLWVSSEFRTNIVAAATPTEAGAIFPKMPRFSLSHNGTGEQMKVERPRSVFTATEFCPWLAAKLAVQPKGEEGELLADGRANLFLVEGVKGEVFLVYVCWGADRQGWYVSTWHLAYGWVAGSRFVSRN